MTEMTVVWQPPTGSPLNLSGADNYQIVLPDDGWYMPPTSLILDYYETHAMVSRVRLEPRILDLPIYIDTQTQAGFVAAVQTLINAFNSVKGLEGTLQVTRQDGAVRHIKGIYFTGLEGSRSQDTYNTLWMEMPLAIKCLDPAWYDPTAKVFIYTTAAPTNFFPFFPLVLSAGNVFGNTIVTNGGSLDAWPVWEVKGPGTNPLFENLATGKKLQFTTVLQVGETLVIDTRPGKKSAVVGSLNKFPDISVDSSLWPLTFNDDGSPKDQTVSITMSNTDSNSEVKLTFNERYLSL